MCTSLFLNCKTQISWIPFVSIFLFANSRCLPAYSGVNDAPYLTWLNEEKHEIGIPERTRDLTLDKLTLIHKVTRSESVSKEE